MSSSKRLVMRCCLEDDGPPQISIPTPREEMRRANCQDYRFHWAETYPSIRTRVSRCDPSKAQAWLANSLEADGCGRLFDMEQNDLLFLWQQCPCKDTLGFYGVGSPSRQPESVMFNQSLMASLKNSNVDGTKRHSKRLSTPEPFKKTLPNSGNFDDNQLCQPYILNRQTLQTELQQMPIVQQRLNPRTAFESLFCPDSVDPFDPLGVGQHEKEVVTRAQALDMERPAKKKLHGLRRRHWYCPPVDSSVGGEQKACFQYECAKYKQEARPKELRQWLGEQQEQEMENPEPRDFDQLYERFLKCFEQEPSTDPICKMYDICCGKKKSHGEDGQGGGDSGGGEGEGEGADRETYITRNKRISQDSNKDKNKEGKQEKDKDKDKDKGKKRRKSKDKPKENENDKEKGKDKDHDKIKKEKADKNKNKDKDKETDDGKDKDKDEGNKLIDVDKYNDEDDTGGDRKKKKKDKKNAKKPSLEVERGPPTDVPEWKKHESFSDSEFPSKENIKRPFNSLVDEIDDKDANKVWDKFIDRPQEIKPEKGKANDTPKGKGKGKEKIKDKDENKDKDKPKKKICPSCPPVHCPCEICTVINPSSVEPDAPFIQEMMREQKKRELKDYYRRMRHRDYIRNSRWETVRPAFHKCDPISCNNFFCQNPNFRKHCDCLGAVQDLQKLLTGSQDKRIDQKLLQRVENLRLRINQRMCDCILI